MRNTQQIILEAEKGATLEQLGADAEELRVLLRTRVTRIPDIVVLFNDKLYRFVLQEVVK